MERQHSTTTRNPNMLRSYEFARNKSKTSRFVNKIKMYTLFTFLPDFHCQQMTLYYCCRRRKNKGDTIAVLLFIS